MSALYSQLSSHGIRKADIGSAESLSVEKIPTMIEG